MSQKQKLADLRQQLERWRLNNEVHAKPADNILYEFLSSLLKLADYDELPEPIEPAQPESIPVVADEVQAQSDEEDEGGGNNPEPPDIP
jgi:hypothetical protein